MRVLLRFQQNFEIKLFLQADHFFFDLDRKVYPLRVTQIKEIAHQTKNKKLNNANEFLFFKKGTVRL